MEILYLLIPLAVILACLIGGVFIWAVNNEQFEDMQGPAQAILLDDDNVETSQHEDSTS